MRTFVYKDLALSNLPDRRFAGQGDRWVSFDEKSTFRDGAQWEDQDCVRFLRATQRSVPDNLEHCNVPNWYTYIHVYIHLCFKHLYIYIYIHIYRRVSAPSHVPASPSSKTKSQDSIREIDQGRGGSRLPPSGQERIE